MTIVLYDNPVSSNAMKVRFLLAELDLDYERRHVPIGRPRPDWYLERYPFGTIPFMQDGEFELGESNAICATWQTGRGAMTSTRSSRASAPGSIGRWTRWSTQFRGNLFPAERIGLMHGDWENGGGRAEDADQVELAAAIDAARPKFELMEKFVADNGTVLGRFTIADCAFAPVLWRWLRLPLSFDAWPKVALLRDTPPPARRSRGWGRWREHPRSVGRRDLVGYGRVPPTFEWPGGAQVVVNLVLVYEEGSEYSVMWGDDRNDGWGEYADPGVQPPQRDPGTESHYEYGSRAGVWRLARIFDAADVPVTISAAAVALELNPAVPEWMREHDHDLLGHGWRWTEAWTYNREDERDSIVRAVETYERVLGSRPAGWNSRGWPSENTRGILRELGGFLYHSEGSADDVPYYELIDDQPMLVVPYSKTYNDSRYLMNPGFASPRDFLETMIMGLDELLREGAERRTMMTVAVHARWSGQAARAAALRLFIEHAQAQPGVAFMRRSDIARWWLEQYPPA